MDFNLTPEQQELQKQVRRFAEEKLDPLVIKADVLNEFPTEIRPELARMGLLGLLVGENYGGTGHTGADNVNMVTALREIARVLPVISIHLQLQNLVAYELEQWGTEEQKQQYLVPLVKGEIFGAFAFTEPDTGSDPQLLKTRARSKDGGFVITGQKRFITNAPLAKFVLVFAKDDQDDISLFIVDTDREGFDVGREENLIGLRGGQLADLHLEDVGVPGENVLGPLGGKFSLLKEAMTIGKLCLDAQCVGIMEEGLKEAMYFARNRIQRGGPILNMKSIHYLIAEMASRTEAAKWLTYQQAFLRDHGTNTWQASAMTKLFVTQTAVEVMRMAVQVHGCYGLSKEYKVERLFRDAKMYELLEGSSEVQRELVARGLIKEFFGSI